MTPFRERCAYYRDIWKLSHCVLRPPWNHVPHFAIGETAILADFERIGFEAVIEDQCVFVDVPGYSLLMLESTGSRDVLYRWVRNTDLRKL